jgi:hypothetical protein
MGVFVERQVFMSKDQEDAANWQMFQNYKEMNGRLGTIAGKIQAWGATMNQIGQQIQTNPYALSNFTAQVANLPDKDDLKKAVEEFSSLRNQLSTLTNHLRQAGLDVSKL